MKYKNKKTSIGGKKFDSKLEAQHYLELIGLLRIKKIRDLARQVRIELTVNAEKHRDKVFYIADFVYFDNEKNEWVIMDSKGMRTQVYVLKRKWLLDHWTGFIFIEKTKRGSKVFIPSGKKKLIFV